MRSSAVLILMLLVCFNACARGAKSTQASAKDAADQEIRTALCDLEKRDYTAVQKRMERVLQTDPKNIYAQKLLLGSFTQQVKPGDQSPENMMHVTKAIESYQQALSNPQFTADEKQQIDSYLLRLYRYLGADQVTTELRKRAKDVARTAKQRGEIYTILASLSWNCSYSITSAKNTPDKTQMEKARQCVATGLADVQQALDLDGENESAWSYKSNLLDEEVKLAGFENNQTQKEQYQQQAREAHKHSNELSARKQAENEKEMAKQDLAREKNDSFTPLEAEKLAQELVDEKRETSLDAAVNGVFIPGVELTTLVAPVPIPEEKTAGTSPDAVPSARRGCFREVDGSAQVQEKRDWKSFAPPEEDITVELPDNVCQSSFGYTAASEGVMYSLTSIPHPAMPLGPTAVEGTLNTLARTYLGIASSGWLGQGLANRFEMKLLRKELVDGQPQKVYTYARVSCSDRKEGVLIVHASSSHYYTIDIAGANESDGRVQHFIRSAKFK